MDWNERGITKNLILTVASFTDAWIETLFSYLISTANIQSHLLQMRGLKPWISRVLLLVRRRIFYRCVDWNYLAIVYISVLPRRIFYRCVDWNYLKRTRKKSQYVASFTDAWIETRFRHIYPNPIGRIFYRCVDWNHNDGSSPLLYIRRIFYRCVDWNWRRIWRWSVA